MTSFRPNQAFDLPPLPPELKQESLFESDMIQLVIKANRTIGELNGLCRAIPNAYPLLMNIPVLQEAVSSSAIEGIHTTVEKLWRAREELNP